MPIRYVPLVAGLSLMACADPGPSQKAIDAAAGTQWTPPPIRLTAVNLVAAYVENEIAADRDYKDKTLVVAGEVGAIAKDILGSPYLILEGPNGEFRDVQAVFDRKDETILSHITKGQRVEVQCVGRGLMMHVQLNGCKLK